MKYYIGQTHYSHFSVSPDPKPPALNNMAADYQLKFISEYENPLAGVRSGHRPAKHRNQVPVQNHGSVSSGYSLSQSQESTRGTPKKALALKMA
jgi:hypothetical protein